MISTIQIDSDVKNFLEKMKTNSRESYQDIILRVLQELEKLKRENRNLMIEGAKEMSNESIKLTKEFEKIEEDFDWSW